MRLFLAAALMASLLASGCGALPEAQGRPQGLESDWIAGNKVTLLFDGPQTMQAMELAIHDAKVSVHLETYIFEQDAVGLRFAQALMERQRAGVPIRIMVDAVGTLRTPPAFFDTLRSAGITLQSFNPVNPFKPHGPWQPNHRDH